jgi:hypothetical protein
VTTQRHWKFALSVLYLLVSFSTRAGETRSVHPPMTFEINRGQVNAEVRFLVRTPQGTIFLTNHEIVFAEHSATANRPLRMHFVQAAESEPVSEAPTGGFVNYYLSKDRRNWLSHLPVFRQIRYRGIFPGTDAVFHGDGQNLEYDFEIAPHGASDQIAFVFDGVDRISRTTDGGLDLAVGTSTWHLLAPEAYQQSGHARVRVDASYEVSRENVVSLRVGDFDRAFPLTIDPVVQYADLFTAAASSTITGLQADAAGDLLIGGDTFAPDYPVVNGQGPSSSGTQQVYVTKLNPAGDTILYSTFLPASNFTNSRALALDPQGNAYLAGITGATDFPLTSSNLGVCGQFCNAGFVAKFDPSGALVYSTLLGSGQILPYSLTVDANGNALVAGGAFDGSLTTVNAYQAAYQGGVCTACGSPFFAKLNSTGTNFIFSSYFGGPGSAAGPSLAKGIALDATGNVLIAGIATADPPLVQPWQYGDGDLFLAEFAPDGKTLLFSTRLGGSGDLQPSFGTMTGMVVGPDGVVYLAGATVTPDFPFTLKAPLLPQTPTGSFSAGTYVLAVDPSLTSLKYSTFLGNNAPNALAIDAANHLHIVGNEALYPPTPAKAVVSDLSQGGYALELDPSGTPVVMTQFGGHFTQQIPTAVAVDANLNLYLAGSVSGGNNFSSFPADPLIAGSSFGKDPGSSANFAAKISPSNAPLLVVSVQNPVLELRNAGSADLHIGNVTFTGGLAKQWGNCGNTIPAATSCVLTVSDANGNLNAGTVTINSDANPPAQTFTLTLPMPVQPGTQPIGDILLFQDVIFAFPPQLQGTPSPSIPLKIWNVGVANASITSVTTSGFTSQTNNCGTLTPGANCTVQVSVSSSPNVFQGALTIGYDANGTQTYNNFYVTSSPQPLLLSTNAISFATQQINGVAIPRVVNVTNTSDATVGAPTASLQGDPAFTIQGTTCAAALAPHQSCAIAVQLTSKAAGTFNGTLTVAGGGGNGQATLFGNTRNNTLVHASPLGLDFGPTPAGSSQTLSVTLTNSASSPYALAGVTFSLADYTETDNCQGQIAVGGTCALSVKFSPQRVGLRRGAASIGISISSLIQSINLAGIGVIPMRVAPASLDFGPNNFVGVPSAVMTVTLQNQLQSAQAYTLTATGDFFAANACASPLPASSTCTLNVTFQPKSAGAQQGTLTVSYPNTLATSVVAVSGSAVEPFALQAASGQATSVTVKAGSSASYSLQAQAAAGFAGNVQLSCSGAPQFASCSVQPASLALTGGGSVSFAVNVATTTTASAGQSRAMIPLFAAMLAVSLLGLSSSATRTFVIMMGFACVLILAGCGGGSSAAPIVTPPSPSNTPPGEYTLTVTGSSGTVSQSITLNLTVN